MIYFWKLFAFDEWFEIADPFGAALAELGKHVPLTSVEFEKFSEFARQKLGNGGAESLEELVDLWRISHPSTQALEESIRALEEGLADAAAGRVRPAEDVFRDLAARYGVELSE